MGHVIGQVEAEGVIAGVAFVATFVLLLVVVRVAIYLGSRVDEVESGTFATKGGVWIDSLRVSWPYARFGSLVRSL